MSLKFCPLVSGSSGNCIYISDGETSFLIDAGISGTGAERALFEIGADIADITAVFVTHEHSDHISGAGILSRRHNIPIYTTPGTWKSFSGHGRLASNNKKMIMPGDAINLGGF